MIYEHSGPAELVLEGENLTPDTLKLYHNGVLYTPLESSDTYAYYLLGDNGTNKVMLNGKNFCTVIVKDIVVPEGFPNFLLMQQSRADGTGAVNTSYLRGANCINYNHVVSGDLTKFYLQIGGSGTYTFNDVDNFNFANCSGTPALNSENNFVFMRMSIADDSKPAYVTYQGFVIAVFNYAE